LPDSASLLNRAARCKAALSVGVSQHGDGADKRKADLQTPNGPVVELELKNFLVSPDYIPDEVQQAVKHWSQWIDYWAIDWDYRDDTFHNQWQSYRTRKDPKIQQHVSHTYDQPGTYIIVIKVIDILGNDTTKSVKIRVE